MNKIQNILKQIESLKSASFVSFTYRSKGSNELARHTLILNYNYEKLLKRDLSKLDAIQVRGNLGKQAKQAIKESLENSLTCLQQGIENARYTRKDSEINLHRGLSFNPSTSTFRVKGLSLSKVILEKGEYKQVNSSALTLAKKTIEKNLAKSKIRELVLDGENLNEVKINGKKLELV